MESKSKRSVAKSTLGGETAGAASATFFAASVASAIASASSLLELPNQQISSFDKAEGAATMVANDDEDEDDVYDSRHAGSA
ncbi:hypothetical protein NC653_004174 [Populus alba x Populus x berolinensis]|uniref:Uncharacterized protein n=1 Tax=Populus alba x Populus x berolinensis TaxID=444605 RepID=A0AAD6RTJ2_9ROSI|nr:hypothetical protein NC653_004174 [Populus alba x Populus x berolinensis]